MLEALLMTAGARQMLITSLDVDADKELLPNEFRDDEHILRNMEVPDGIFSKRYTTEPLALIPSGTQTALVTQSEPCHRALSDLESADVPTSPARARCTRRWTMALGRAAIRP
jgi:hypothetical protein